MVRETGCRAHGPSSSRPARDWRAGPALPGSAPRLGPTFLLAPLIVGPVIPFNPLFALIMALAVGVVALVMALLAYSLLRTRRRPEDGLPRQEFGNRRLEIGWTIAPAVVVLALFGLTFYSMRATPTPGSGLPEGRQPDIVVTGHQWWWEISYPQRGITTANELHLPTGERLLVQLLSADVQHNFWVPQLGQKMDMYPGKSNYLWLEAREPGVYQGVCSEYCGGPHAWMRILAVARPPAEFDRWAQEQRTPPGVLPTRLAEQGRQIYVNRNCGSCHAIAGVSAGQAAPELSHFGGRRTISAGVLENTPENLARYLENPQAIKPGIQMPNFRLAPDEIEALVAYLESLR